jgi:hypothetical protein
MHCALLLANPSADSGLALSKEQDKSNLLNSKSANGCRHYTLQNN